MKSLKAYIKLIKKYKNQTFDDWDLKYFLEGRNELTNKVNNLYRFLTLAPFDFPCWCVYEENHITALNGKGGFKEAYEYYLYREKCNEKKWKKDKTTLEKLGYKYEEMNICGKCGKKPENKQCGCNTEFERKNRRKRIVIKHLKIIREGDVKKYSKHITKENECEINNDSDSDCSIEED